MADLDVHLAGRGLVLVPSYFCGRWPVVNHDPDSGDAPALLYPVRRRVLAPPARDGRGGGPPLAAALGRTRAALLELVADYTTTALGRQLLDQSGASGFRSSSNLWTTMP